MLRICRSTILFSTVIAVNLLTGNLPAHSQSTNSNTPNTNTPQPNMRLVLKNGAEVRGEFVEYKDGKYTFRLPDGRMITYPATEVDRMEALPVSQTVTPIQTIPTETTTTNTENVSCRTFITDKNIDLTYYTPLEDVEVEGTYGELAEEAREKGADAVIGVRVWEGNGTWSWTATYTSGLAIKWTDAGRQALRNLDGRCY